MTVHRYSARARRGDLLRVAMGLALTGGPLVALDTGSWVAWILGPLAVLFLIFGIRTFMRGIALVRVAEDGLSWHPFGDREVALPGCRRVGLAWRDIQTVRLKFFSTKRDRSEGWMELRLGDGARKLMLDSTLEGFEAICARVERAAIDNRLSLDETTTENLRALARGKGLPRA